MAAEGTSMTTPAGMTWPLDKVNDLLTFRWNEAAPAGSRRIVSLMKLSTFFMACNAELVKTPSCSASTARISSRSSGTYWG